MSIFVSMDRRRIVTILATLGLAFATGHVMQTVLVKKRDVSTLRDAPDVAPHVRSDETAPSLPAPPAATLIPFVPPEPTPRERVPEDPPLTEFEQEDARYPAFDTPCSVTADARVIPGAVARVTIDAPCLAGLPVTLQQEGLQVTWQLDETGWLAVDVPVLSHVTDLVADMPGESLEWRLIVAEAVPDRVAVLGGGARELRLSQPGLVLGDGSGATAEVLDTPPRDVSIEAFVTLDTCGRTLSGTLVRSGPDGVIPQSVVLSMPGCDAVGEVVVLPEVFGGRRLAAN